MDIITYIKPELLTAAIALYFAGMGLKKTERIKDKYIPVILGIAGIVMALIFVLATSTLGTWQDILKEIFTAIVQGILIAAASTYVNQLIKQAGKSE